MAAFSSVFTNQEGTGTARKDCSTPVTSLGSPCEVGVTVAGTTLVGVVSLLPGETRFLNRLTCGRGTKNTTRMAAATATTSARWVQGTRCHLPRGSDRKSTRLNSSHLGISYAVF